MNDWRRLDELLRAEDGDAGCDAGAEIMEDYVERELAGEDPSDTYPGTARHLRTCPSCRADHDGLAEAARRFRGAAPE
jgi:predicted anti-sigma-YlaC factor YlaD